MAGIPRMLLWSLLTTSLVAQEGAFERLRLRVSSVMADGRCVVDRGSRDRVESGDRVVLTPTGGGTLLGRVVRVEERTALVEMVDPKAAAERGMRGHVMLPKSRLPQPEPEPQPEVEKPAPAAGEDEWQPGMPLLGNRRPPHPKERLSRMRGRIYGSLDLVRTLDSFSQSSMRTGADVDINNIDGEGGRARFHGEFLRSKEFSGNVGNDLRIYEFSYGGGGTRFNPVNWQIGRFLQSDMPEFSILDGAEIGYRTEDGNRFGASLGFLPELDDDMDSGEDLQIAAWYVWNPDHEGRVSYALGVQKTWHNGISDRDLFVARMRYLPEDGWDLSAVVFADLYDDRDVGKEETVEITRANLLAARRWQGQGGLRLFYDHEEYPLLRRRENAQALLPQTLLGAHVDRLTAYGWIDGDDSAQWFSRCTAWSDEDDTGGAVELGWQGTGLLGISGRTGVTTFYNKTATNDQVGLRIDYGDQMSFGRLDALYEVGLVRFDDFPSAFDELLQHRVGVLATTSIGSGWDVSFHTDATLWDNELSFGLGFYLQRLF